MSSSRSLAGLIFSLCIVGTAHGSTGGTSSPLSIQMAGIPEDFRSQLFNSPISARVMLDGQLLGDAIIVLKEDDRVQLINFTDSAESELDESERQRWVTALSEPLLLGECTSKCPSGLLASDYNLSNAQLSLITNDANTGNKNRWHAMPENSGTGFILSNQFNASGGQQQPAAFNWNGGIEAGIGNWTGVSQFQLDRSSANNADTRHAITSLYALREGKQHFLRAGLFMPDSQGLLRQPYTRGSSITTLAGVMLGSSDTLLKDGNSESLYPIYVTANREGIAEIYRDGVLINSQPVVPGIQALDTLPLPGGIYEVEIRIKEDGKETSRNIETINKPAGWRNPEERMRFNMFAGRQSSLWNSDKSLQDGGLAAGASMNYLLLPTLTAGAALQKTRNEHQAGISLDWQAAKSMQLYGNLWNSSKTGFGFDSQALWTYSRGNVALTHSRSWYVPQDDLGNTLYCREGRSEQSTGLSSSLRIDNVNSINGRVSHHSANNGLGVDVGYSTRTQLADTGINWRLSAFDRPYRDGSSLRNQGVSLTASFALGGDKRSASASVGSRTDSRGSRDLYASASLSQEWENSPITSTSASITADRYGAGLSTNNNFDTSVMTGSFWGQQSSMDRKLYGGVNVGSMLAFGQGNAVMSRDAMHHQGGGMIVDVISDDPNANLMAYHDGGNTPMKVGRNFIPVNAWKPGTVKIDFPGSEAPALKVLPEYLDYHLVRGGVNSYQVKVMKTVTVMGRIVNSQGTALGGAKVINHAGKTITENDGLFTLELHENNPVIAVEHHSGIKCEIQFTPDSQKRQDDFIYAGDLSCKES